MARDVLVLSSLGDPASERVERVLADWVGRGAFLGLEAWQWIGLACVAGAAVGVGLVTGALVKLLRTFTKRTPIQWDDELVLMLQRPSRFLGGVAAAAGLVRLLRLPASAEVVIDRLLQMTLVFSLAWVAMGLVRVVATIIELRAERAAEGAADRDRKLRGLRTQVVVLRRVAAILIGVVAFAIMLMQFEIVRTVGLSLLASAGVAGIVLGIAAQRTLASLLAGIQLSIVQAVRIGDTIVLDGETGEVEEINLTYLVVRLWDERRVIAPVSRFLEQPFQNWTKASPELHGTVFLYADYGVPVDRVRAELDRILEGHAKWDGRTKTVVVADMNDRALQLRVLVSAADASSLADLRADVRERLVAWLASFEGGRHLPRAREESVGAAR